MRHPALIMLAIGLVVFAGCGRQNQMSDEQAMDMLASMPMSSGGSTKSVDENTDVSVDTLNAVILQAASQTSLSGKARLAVSTTSGAPKIDLTVLNQLLGLLQGQNGQPNIIQIVQQLLNMNAGNASGTGSKLDAILALITQLAPVIATIAPQFAPIITAVTTILPLVMNIINMFKKPKPSPSAAVFYRAPVLA